MAAATQVTSHNPNKAYGGSITSSQTLNANGTLLDIRQYPLSVQRFSAVANTNTHATGIKNIQHVWVKSDDVDAVNAPAVHWSAAGVLTFAMGASSWTGEILIAADDPNFEAGGKRLL